MEKKILLDHLNQHVKLVLKPSFVLDGWITAVMEDTIEFRTKTKTSYISFDSIASLMRDE